MSVFDEIRALHVKYGADADLAEPDGAGMPDGWQVAIRRWGKGCYDALIMPPADQIGWRLAGDFARTAGGARRRAKREIEAHLARTASAA